MNKAIKVYFFRTGKLLNISTVAGQEIVDTDYVVPIRNPQELYMKMDKMLQLPSQELADLGHADFLDSNRFDIHSVALQWNKIYSHTKNLF